MGEDKYLVIIYNYRNQAHEVTIKDNEALRIPKTCKLLILMHIVCKIKKLIFLAHRTSVT